METRVIAWVTAGALLALVGVATSSCPTECKCRPINRLREKLEADCANRSLTTLPQHFSHHIVKLNVSFNNFTALSAEFFGHGTRDIYTVILSNNSIATIDESTFSPLPDLWIVDLSGNKLETLNRNTFAKNTKLWYLILRGNNIKMPSHSSFLYIPKLGKLDLSYNNIDTIEDESFDDMNKLTYLRLHNNRLNSLSPSWFRGLKNLLHLFLEDNDLHYLYPDTFVHAEKLIELSLSRNRLMIPSGKPFLRIPSLEILYLNGCNLTHLPGEMFELLTRLRYVFLSHNRLSTLDTGLLRYLDDLVYLNVCDNLLACGCDLKDAWQWCRYRGVKADVNCGVGGAPQEQCAGSWDAVGDMPCNETTPTTSTITPAPESIRAESAGEAGTSHVGLFVGLGVLMLVAGLVVAGVFYWRRSTQRPVNPQNHTRLNTTYADMMPLHDEHQEA